jgi:hypothetical protein
MRNSIKKRSSAAIIIFSFLFLASCSTSYQEVGFFGGGYSEIARAKDSFIVNFYGNQFTSSNNVMKFALKRASELTLQNGYKYFYVDSTQDKTSVKKSVHTYNEGATKKNPTIVDYLRYPEITQYSEKTSTYVDKTVSPGITLSIKCFSKKPRDLNVVDAEYFLLHNQGS